MLNDISHRMFYLEYVYELIWASMLHLVQIICYLGSLFGWQL